MIPWPYLCLVLQNLNPLPVLYFFLCLCDKVYHKQEVWLAFFCINLVRLSPDNNYLCIVLQNLNPLPVLYFFFCLCDEVYYKQEVYFLLYSLGQIVT